jgi:outer membrane protein TolC
MRILVFAHGLVLALAALTGQVTVAATLADAIGAALQIEQQESRVGALRNESAAVRRQAAQLIASNPSLRGKSVSASPPGSLGTYEQEALLDLPLWMPGQPGARRAVAASLGNQADALLRLLRWEMAGRVREAAWTTALAQGRLQQAMAALASARSLELAIGKRSSAGELARKDLLMARQDTLAREVDRQAAQLDYDRAIQTYIHLTGLRTLPNPLVETVVAQAGGDAELPANHPRLVSGDSAVAQAQAERERVRSDRLGHPILSVGGKRVRDGRGTEATDALQLEINIPLAMPSQSAPALAGAERSYTEQVTTRQRTRLEIELTLQTARLEVSGAAAALEVAIRRQVVTQDAYKLVRRGFDLGESDLAIMLQAQERAQQASLNLELRRLEQGRAFARLNQAQGSVPE